MHWLYGESNTMCETEIEIDSLEDLMKFIKDNKYDIKIHHNDDGTYNITILDQEY